MKVLKKITTVGGLKALAAAPTYHAKGDRFEAIPHARLISALRAAMPATPAIELEADPAKGTFAAVLVPPSDEAFMPTLFVLSAHTGRQPADVLFGHTFRVGKDKLVSLVTSRSLVTQKHTKDADLEAWATAAVEVLDAGSTPAKAAAMTAWWTARRKVRLTDSQTADALVGLSARLPCRPSKIMPPLGNRYAPAEVAAILAAGASEVGPTDAALIRAVYEYVGGLGSLYHKVNRLSGLFRRLGSRTPPDVYAA